MLNTGYVFLVRVHSPFLHASSNLFSVGEKQYNLIVAHFLQMDWGWLRDLTELY